MRKTYYKCFPTHHPDGHKKGAFRPSGYLRVHTPLCTVLRIGHLYRWLPPHRQRRQKIG